ncbi:hypothetical protein BEN47_19620 [Hymenobacter lapidarius]|uniref:Arm DNA-binding domain-containing protein n=1 Tax=Hymenobacter lapidarius TaxID=1908237 RepID=A0A1G1TF40_9BACT|nr:hypothetical protein [Hymenobacter lapidarius]OGX89488.1 hypothetical protein BEN47_19620 [Hymenobacter lapidarius]
MATVSFHLKDPKANKPTPVFILFNPHNGTPRVRIYTGEKILPAYWTGGNVQQALTKGRSINAELKRTHETLNASLTRMSKRLLAYWNEYRSQGKLPSDTQLREAVEPEAAPAAPAPAPCPLADLLAYKDRHARTRQPNTVKALGTLYNHLVRYEQLSGQALTYEGFTKNFGTISPLTFSTQPDYKTTVSPSSWLT